MEVIRIFDAQPVKYPILRACWSVNKYGDPIFLLHFFNVHIINVNYAKFQKKFDSKNNFKGITLSLYNLICSRLLPSQIVCISFKSSCLATFGNAVFFSTEFVLLSQWSSISGSLYPISITVFYLCLLSFTNMLFLYLFVHRLTKQLYLERH